MKLIDLRSDTVTRPTPEMRVAMAEARVGDDVFGEDPTVNRLESLAAEMLGTEAAIFTSSGTQANLLALLSCCERGDEYIVGQQAHNYRWEGGGAAVLGSIQPQPLDFEDDGTLDLHKVAQAIKPNDYHFARTKLLCLENTQAGKVLPLNYIQKASTLAGHHRLGIHLDGARAFNAAVKLNINIQKISQHFDSISICLSKGLGAPVGSVLCSTRERINKARRWRKVLGGGMRQAGIIAAAGIFALENNVERMAEDHNNALILANGLAQIDELYIDLKWVQTNMVFVTVDKTHSGPLTEYLKQKGILIFGGETIRLVTHLDVTEDDMITAIESIKGFFSRKTHMP